METPNKEKKLKSDFLRVDPGELETQVVKSLYRVFGTKTGIDLSVSSNDQGGNTFEALIEFKDLRWTMAVFGTLPVCESYIYRVSFDWTPELSRFFSSLVSENSCGSQKFVRDYIIHNIIHQVYEKAAELCCMLEGTEDTDSGIVIG